MGKEAKRVEAIREMFSCLAPYYDLGNKVLSLGQDQVWRRYAARLASPVKPGLVLDVATGTADLAIALARLGHQVVALDFCPEMVGFGSNKIKDSPWKGKINFLLGDALSLPFFSNTFDAVTIGFGIRNILELHKCLAEMKRVLKKEGHLVVLELFRPVKGLTGTIHGFYLSHLVPVMGSFLSGQIAAYRYLSGSIWRFSSPDDIRVCLEGAGLNHVSAFRLGLGAAMVYSAKK